ncbi:helix-turn-helix transcriptional regulator, partial [Salmonella enterica]|nr:helix-turn-helix transcriptional regulator [Salmonella enterica]
PTPLFLYIKKLKLHPRFIFLSRFDDISLNGFLGCNDGLSLQHSLSNLRHIILSNKNNRPTHTFSTLPLSPREAMVIHLSMDGISAKKIAIILGINSKTVYAHRKRACDKLGVDKLSKLVQYKSLVQYKVWDTRKE